MASVDDVDGSSAMVHGSTLCGYLMKRSGGRGRKMQRRWFVLHGRMLSYFTRYDDAQRRGFIDLQGTRVTLPEGNPAEFEIVTRRKTYLLAGDNADEVAAWVAALRRSVAMFANVVTRRSTVGSERNDDVPWSELKKATYAGVVRKQGKGFQSWRSRYLVCIGGVAPVLLYFRQEPIGAAYERYPPLGRIPLLQAHLIQPVPQDPHTFAIITHEKQYRFRVDSDADLAAWLQAIQSCIA
ncbi:PH domain-containing protein [Plasmodiophora brassicae]|nr:hypothetical protein PBRA_005824 [Plasmodiophora brassicae]